jgi:sortase A
VARVVRGVGWTLIVMGSVVLLYVVYLLWFTGLETASEQRELSERFDTLTSAPLPTAGGGAAPDADADGDGDGDGDGEDDPEPVEVGDAFAAMWFERDGDRIVSDDVLFVVEGTSVADLKRGPGHYPETAEVGGDGNLGIAGHRSTYGEPFGRLDELTEGDTIHVVDRRGTEWVYAFREQRVVAPTDVWVIEEDDPLDLGAPTITLTTCHPRFSAAQRLIAWGELIGPAEA